MKVADIRIEQLLQQAEAKQRVEHDEGEALKQGVLRGGNSGALTDTGEIHGNCHRRTLLRFLGIDSPTDDRAVHFFRAGASNEVEWAKLLSEVWPGRVLREEETGIAWSLPHPGTGEEVAVTGRPDVVLCDDDGVPQTGIELKKVCSSYRAVKTFMQFDPSPEHLVQAAHYSWQLGKLPWILSYTSDSSYDTPGWCWKAKYPWLQPVQRKIQPGRMHFYLGWQDDTFCFIHPLTGQVVPTKITSAGIERYYQLVLAMDATRQVGPRPSEDPIYEGGGDPDPCKYCAFKAACDKADRTDDFDEWLDAARVAATQGGDE